MAILDFTVSGWHVFSSVTQVCFGISVSNFMCMSFVAVGRSLTFVSYVTFKMAALWFWTMFNCNPPIAHCHPLLWGGGILVDHWSTISSLHQYFVIRMPAFFLKKIHLKTVDGCILFFTGEKGECFLMILTISFRKHMYTVVKLFFSLLTSFI